MSTTSSTADRFAYQYQQPPKRTFGQRLRAMFCCGTHDDSEEDSIRSMKMQISAPTDFRREEINIPGMSPSQERFVREKALSDARKLFENLQPLRSSPSSQFAQRPEHQPRISYEQFTTPRTPQSAGWETLKAHGRRFSDQLKKPLHGERMPVTREGNSAVEMMALVNDASQSKVGSPVVGVGKMSEESWESDSAKAVMEGRLGRLGPGRC